MTTQVERLRAVAAEGYRFAGEAADTIEKFHTALLWLAECADPEKLTGSFARDHARRALGLPVDE